MSHLPRNTILIAAPALAIAMLPACTAAPAPGTVRDSPTSFPVVVNNCGTEISVDSPPERVMLLESAPVTILDGIGVFDRVSARAGSFPLNYYDDDLARTVSQVPALSDDVDASGHVVISQEQIIAQTPDLVLGQLEGISRETLAGAGATVLVQELLCPGNTAEASFDTLYQEIERYGQVFDRREEATALVDDLRSRVDAVRSRTAGRDRKTAAVLYPSTGGGPLYAYGSGSMAQPQLDAAGLDNVFAANAERVFEVQSEQLISADPDVLILLHQGSDDGVERAVTSLPGAQTIDAVSEGRVITQLFNFTEPASPLTVTGLERIHARLDGAIR